MDKIFINGKEFSREDPHKPYGEESKRNNIIFLPKDHYKNLEKFYSNFDSMKKFMKLVLSPDQYDCWLYQNQYIKDKYFGDKPIYKTKKYSSEIKFVDDIESKEHKVKKKDIQMYLDTIYERYNKENK